MTSILNTNFGSDLSFRAVAAVAEARQRAHCAGNVCSRRRCKARTLGIVVAPALSDGNISAMSVSVTDTRSNFQLGCKEHQ
jgi:hypothetical protein